MYAKDLSRKVKSAKRQRALNGLFISAHTPYGYIKDPTNKNHLIVDEDVRHVIELIFNMCVNEKGAPTIAKVLEEKGVLNPAAYKTLKGSTTFLVSSKATLLGKASPLGLAAGYVLTTWQYYNLIRSIVTTPDFENSRWILY